MGLGMSVPRRWLAVLLVALVAPIVAFAQPRQDPQASGADFYVVNNGPVPIEQIYVSPSGDRNWGRDRLSRTVIERGDSFLVRNTVPDGCQADVRVVFAGNAQVERRNQNLCRINRMYFTTPARPGRRTPATEITIRNEGDVLLESLYISRAGEREWGRDWLASGSAIEGQGNRRVQIGADHGCQVDIRADFQGGGKVGFYNENICAQTSIVFFAPDANPISPPRRRPDSVVQQDPPTTGGGDLPRERDREPAGPTIGGPARTDDTRPRRDGGSGNLTVVNNYRVPLRELYVSPSSQREWGRDLLPDRVLVAPRDRYAVQVETARDCQFDIKAVWDSDAEEVMRNTNLCAGRPVALSGPPPNKPLWSGTGFYVGRTGHVLTNRHVIYGCQRVEIQRPNGPGTALNLVGEDEGNDLALLQETGAQIRPVVFRATTRTLRNGEPSIALGYPIREVLGSLIVTSGIISSLSGGKGDASRFQMQTPIQPGNSGGPVFDETGQLIGVSVARIERVGGRNIQNVNFAVKADVARKFIESHGVQVEQAAPGPRLTPADIIEQQETKVLALICYN